MVVPIEVRFCRLTLSDGGAVEMFSNALGVQTAFPCFLVRKHYWPPFIAIVPSLVLPVFHSLLDACTSVGAQSSRSQRVHATATYKAARHALR